MELLRFYRQGEVIWIPGDPGDTYTKGDLITVTAGEGVADILADSEVPYGVVAKSTVCPSLATNFPLPAEFDPVENATDDKTLIPIIPFISEGTPIFSCTFRGQVDDTVVTYTSGTPQVELTTGAAADDYPNGALVYVYEGAGIGEVNVVADYDHTGGAVEKMLVLHRAFKATVGATSKIIIVSGEAATNKGVSPLGRMDAYDVNELHAADGADDGNFVVMCSWEQLGSQLSQLRLPVIHANALLASS
jgi:hypothetical protein